MTLFHCPNIPSLYYYYYRTENHKPVAETNSTSLYDVKTFLLKLYGYVKTLTSDITEKHKNIVFLNVCCVMMLYVFLCRSVC